MDILSQHYFFDAEREDISTDGESPLTLHLGRKKKFGMYILLLHKDGRSLKLCAL